MAIIAFIMSYRFLRTASPRFVGQPEPWMVSFRTKWTCRRRSIPII